MNAVLWSYIPMWNWMKYIIIRMLLLVLYCVASCSFLYNFCCDAASQTKNWTVQKQQSPFDCDAGSQTENWTAQEQQSPFGCDATLQTENWNLKSNKVRSVVTLLHRLKIEIYKSNKSVRLWRCFPDWKLNCTRATKSVRLWNCFQTENWTAQEPQCPFGCDAASQTENWTAQEQQSPLRPLNCGGYYDRRVDTHGGCHASVKTNKALPVKWRYRFRVETFAVQPGSDYPGSNYQEPTPAESLSLCTYVLVTFGSITNLL
jgi:hypothetical protein